MAIHEVIITPLTEKDGTTTSYDLAVSAGAHTKRNIYESLESALDSFNPSLSARVRSHVVEGVHGERKPGCFLSGGFV
jgi:hypothetical protein